MSRTDYWIAAGHCPFRLPLMVTEIGETSHRSGHRTVRQPSRIMALELVLRGQLRLEQDGRSSLIGAGEAAVLKRGVDHAYAAVGGAHRKVYVGIAGTLAEELTAALPDRVRLRAPASAAARFAALRRLFRAQPADWMVTASRLAYGLLTELAVSAQAEQGARELHPAVARALPLLRAGEARRVRMGQLARAVGVSAAHLHRLFRAELDTTPQRYAREAAMRRAQAELTGGERPCAEIARRLGYDDPLYFSAVFRRVVGESPTSYRRRHR
jgi:AraC-like DNA-binding protein